jgi:hypothetical protein
MEEHNLGREKWKRMSDEVKPKPFIEVPVAVMADLLQAAAAGYFYEDPNKTVRMSMRSFIVLRYFIRRGMKKNPEAAVRAEMEETLEKLFTGISTSVLDILDKLMRGEE